MQPRKLDISWWCQYARPVMLHSDNFSQNRFTILFLSRTTTTTIILFLKNKHYYIFIIYLANMIRHTLLSRFQMPALRSPIITITTHPKRKERLPAVYIDSLISLQLVERLTHLNVKSLTEFQQVSLPSFQCHRRTDGCTTNMQRTLSPPRPIYRKMVKY